MTKYEMIENIIAEMTDDEKMYLWNEYCYDACRYNDEIFDFDRLCEMCESQTPEWIIGRVYFGKFEYNSPYFKFNGYGNFESVWNVEEDCYFDEMIEYMIDNDFSACNDEIEEVLANDELVES